MSLFRKTTDDYAEEGNELFDEKKYEQAIKVWQEGLDQLDKPLNMQSEAVWFQTSIADALFMMDRFEEAYDYLWDAKSNLSGEGVNNPFVLMRLGQCAYELGKDNAREFLLMAYMIEGEELFENDDEKYLDAIRDMI